MESDVKGVKLCISCGNSLFVVIGNYKLEKFMLKQKFTDKENLHLGK